MSETGIDNRKDLLLLVLEGNGAKPVLGVTRLQKYLFLLQKEHGWDSKFEIEKPYDFEAYNYGPFDSQIYGDLDLLENVGLIRRRPAGQEPGAEHEEMRYLSFESATTDREFQPWEEQSEVEEFELTDRGQEFVATRLRLPEEDRRALEEMKTRWNNAPLNDLLRWLYKEHPEYAANTKLQHLKSP